jgi:glyoxylase-like metal-dependent hydrolase (beta-lactamase superfamily II)
LLVLAAGLPLRAGEAVRVAPSAADSSAYHLVKVADGIHVFLAPEGVTPIVSGNTTVIIGEEGVLVVDTGQFPSVARHHITAIRRLTSKPVRYIVNTHWHPDHWLGNAEYQRAYPGVVTLSTANTRHMADTKARQSLSPRYAEEALGVVKELLARGQRENGTPLSPIELGYYGTALQQFQVYKPELEAVKAVLPQVTFKEGVTLHLGGLEVRVFCPGRGNTGGDAVVYLPTRKVLVTGDLLVAPFPYAIGSFIGEWIQSLAVLNALAADQIIPGHGPVLSDKSYLNQVRGLLISIRDQTKEAVDRGLSLQEAQAAIQIEAFRKAMCGEDAWRQFGFDSNFLRPAVARAYREAKEGPLQDED